MQSALSKEEMEAILISHGLSEAEAKQTAATFAASAANTTATASTYGLTAAVTGLFTILKANPWILAVAAIAGIIAGTTALNNKLEETKQKIAEASEEAASTISSVQESFAEKSKTVSEISERFAELAQGVDLLSGANTSLSTDEYAEFLDLSNQLADVFPTLTRTYDENGNAIVQLSGDTDTMVASLQNLLDVQRQLANEQIVEKLPDLYKGIQQSSDSYKAEIRSLESVASGINSIIEAANNMSAEDFADNLISFSDSKYGISQSQINDIQNIVKRYVEGINVTVGEEVLNPFTQEFSPSEVIFSLDYGEMSADEIINANEAILVALRNELPELYKDELSNIRSQILSEEEKNKANWSGLTSGLNAWLTTDTSYQTLSDDMRNVVQTMMGNIDFASLNFSNFDALTKHIQTEIISKIQESTEVQQAFSELFNVKPLDKSVDLYLTDLNNAVDKIVDVSNGTWTRDDVLKNTGFGDIIKQQEDNINRLFDKLNTPDSYFFDSWMIDNIKSLTSSELSKALQLVENYGIETWGQLQDALNSKTYDIVLNLDVEKSGIEALNSAIEESLSATGMTSDSVANLTNRYKELAEFDAAKLFEQTATGIRLNSTELNKLESVYKKQKIDDTTEKLEGLKKEYERLTEKIEDAGEGVDKSDLFNQRDNILAEIKSTAALAAEYQGLTSAYNSWLQAKSAGNERDAYASVLEGKEDVEDRLSRGWIDDTVRAYVDMLSSADLANASAQEVIDAYNNLLTNNIGGFNIFDFFTADADGNATSDGIFNFIDAVIAKQKELNENWITQGADGKYDIDFGFANDLEVAQQLGMDVEALQMILQAMRDAGFDVHLDSTYSEFATLQSRAEEAYSVLKQLDGIELNIDFESTDIETVHKQLEDTVDVLHNIEPGTEGFDEAQYLIAHLYNRLQSLSEDPAILKINTSEVGEETAAAIEKIKEFDTACKELELNTLQMDVEGIEVSQTKVEELLAQIKDLPEAAKLGITPDMSYEEVISTLRELDQETIQANLGINAEAFETFVADNSVFEFDCVTGSVDDSTYRLWTSQNSTHHVKTVIDPPSSNASIPYSRLGYRPNFAQGTAYAHGDYGLKSSGAGLGGELGEELVVRNGKFFTIGKDSAEFFRYRKGDIIFNAEQTRQIFKNGKILNGAKRGVAYAQGNAFSDAGGYDNRDALKALANLSATGSTRGTGSSVSEKDKEKFDWIEVALSRIERAIDKLKNVASSAYKSIESAAKASRDAISMSTTELVMQQKAYLRYMEEANSVGLSDDLVELVQNGAIDISLYDEETQTKIDEYNDLYDKAIDCSDAIEEIHEEIASMYEDIFNRIEDNMNNQLDLLAHSTNRYDTGMDMLEAMGYLDSSKLHEASNEIQKQNLAVLNAELENLKQAFSDAMVSGEIEEGSEAWFAMTLAINDVKEQIDDVNLAILETNKAIQELEWSHFDYLQDRISRITDEADFLIELMGNSDLHTDNGILTDAGNATMGLHGMNLNTYMHQANQYADEILKIDKQLAEDPYNVDLIERREELLDLQQDSILAAENEKQAIVSLVEEGINLELEALQELIDKYSEALDSAKDLYDYQNKISDQTSEISSIRKQLAAYSGDSSEETKSTIQKLQVELNKAIKDLEETQYDQYISDQKKLLDELYEEYSLVLNQRLDNVDDLIEETIATINSNTDSINATITEVGDDVGYTMSENLKTVWDGSTDSIEGTISVYGDGFNEKLTSINSVLNGIQDLVSSMIDLSDNESSEVVTSTNNTTTPQSSTVQNTSNYEDSVVLETQTQSSTASNTSTSTSSSSKKPKTPPAEHQHAYILTKKVQPTTTSQGYDEWRCSCGAWLRGNYKPKLPKNVELDKDILKFASGGLADFTGLAQLDGTKQKPELVLNPRDTQNFLALKETLSKMRAQGLSIGSVGNYPAVSAPKLQGITDISSLVSSIRDKQYTDTSKSVGDVNVEISIDRVQDYNDFVNQLRNDGKFEKFIQTITTNRYLGESSLSKNRYRW